MLYTNKELSVEMVNDYYTKYINSKEYKDYVSCYKSYLGEYTILSETKPIWQPNNKLVNNFAKNITDTFSGFVASNGITVTGRDETIMNFDKINNISTKNMQLVRNAIKYGLCYELFYQDEDGNTRNAVIEPTNAFMIYDLSIEQKPLYFVRFMKDDEGNMNGEVYSNDKVYSFTGTDEISELKLEHDNIYHEIPVAIWELNEEQRGIFIDQLSLIDAYNKVISNKLNDIEAFSDAYLVLKDVLINTPDDMDDDDLIKNMQKATNDFVKNIRDSHVIVMNSTQNDNGGNNNSSAEFITKPSDDASQENALNRLESQIYSLSSVVNFNNESFGNSSGIALQLRLQPMRDLMGSFTELCKNSLNHRYRLVCSLPNIKNHDAYLDLQYTFIENTPKDIKNEAETLAILMSTVSKETALKQVSFITDAEEEIKRIQAEQSDKLYE